MQVRELLVPDALEVTPVQHTDERGVFLEWYRADKLREATGREFRLAQSNLSSSARGVARGIHYSDVPPGQAKYVTVVAGAGLDIVVDLRVGSPTFGLSDAAELSAENRHAIFIPEGLGHAFIALTDGATINYLTTDIYKPEAERTVSLLDSTLNLALPFPAESLILSKKDHEAPGLERARELGHLPTLSSCKAVYALNRSGASS